MISRIFIQLLILTRKLTRSFSDTFKLVNTNLTPAFSMKLSLCSMVLVVRKGTTKHTLAITFDIIATRRHQVESFSHSYNR